MSSRRIRMGLIGAAVAALLLTAAISLPAFGGSGNAHQSSNASNAAKALKLAQEADQRSKDAAALVPASGPGGGEGAKGQKGAQGPSGAQGANGGNGVNGSNGPNGANGGKGAAGANGTPGANGNAIRAIVVGDPDPPLETENQGNDPDDAFSLGTASIPEVGADEWLILTVTLNGTTSANCAPGGGLQVFVLIDGQLVTTGFLPWNFFHFAPPPQPPIDFTDAPMQTAIVAPTGSDGDRTIETRVSDNCGNGGDSDYRWLVRRVQVTVGGTGPPVSAT